MKRTILTLAVSMALAVGCQQAEEAAADASTAVDQAKETAGNAADAAGDAANDLVENAEQAGSDVADAVDQMTDDAKAAYEKVQAELKAKEGELAELQTKMKDLSPSDLLEGKGKELADQADKLTGEIQGLMQQLEDLGK